MGREGVNLVRCLMGFDVFFLIHFREGDFFLNHFCFFFFLGGEGSFSIRAIFRVVFF